MISTQLLLVILFDEDIDQFTKRIVKDVYKNGIELVPDVQKLINHLSDNNIPMAIATNANEPQLKAFLNSTNGLDLKFFSHYVCGADDPEVKSNKPSLEIYVVCAQLFKTPC